MKSGAWEILWMALALGFLPCSCGKGEKVSGATSVTTNGELTATVKYNDGSPAVGAKVLLVDEQFWLRNLDAPDSLVLDSALTDGNGKCVVHIPYGRRSNLQIISSEGLFYRHADSLMAGGKTKVSKQFRLKSFVPLSGNVITDGEAPFSLRLAGSTMQTRVAADGAYRFETVPPGMFDVVALNTGLTGAPRTAGTAVLPDGAEAVERDFFIRANALLLDDFEAGWGQSFPGRLAGDGWWYTHQDNGVGGKSTVAVSIIESAQSFRGKSVRAIYMLDSAISQPWAIIGVQLGADPAEDVFDLSSLTAIEFAARGSGRVSVKLMSRVITEKSSSNWYQFYFNVALAPDWTTYMVPVDSFRVPSRAPAEIKSISWPEAALEIHSIDFTVESPESSAGDTVRLWLDDVYLEGMRLTDFYPQ